MSNQTNNDMKNTNNTDTEQTVGGFAKAVEFCKRNVSYIAIAGLFIVLVIVLVRFMQSSPSEQDMALRTEATEQIDSPTEVAEAPEAYAKDAIPEVNQLITNYYTAYANGDIETLATLADPLSDTQKSYISVYSQYVENYGNIACYTKKGLEDTSVVASVYTEVKFKDVETVAPGLETFYLRVREDGSYYIDTVYGLFNSKMKEFDVDETVSDFLNAFSKQEDVATMQTEVWQKYEAALASDESLKTVIETTIPDAMAVWSADQKAAAKKAEEEQKAAEEAAKKAAEEEAAKQQKEAELAAAVTVYTTDKVNVRASASEEAEVLGQLEPGSQTTRLEERDDGWSRINYSDGIEGYVKSEYLSTEQPAAPETPEAEQEETSAPAKGFAEGTVITLTESVNVRKSMSEDAEKVAVAFAGEQVTVIFSYAEGWTKVSYGEKTGFIKTELLQ